MDFYKAPQTIEEVFDLIGQVLVGKKLLNQFLKRYAKIVEIKPYPTTLINRLRMELPPGHPIGACFIHDGSTGTIHYDPKAELGILAPFLVHELAHATDAQLWKVSQLKEGSSARKRILFQAELNAFRLQQSFIKDLKKLIPEYSQFITFAQRKIRVLAEDLGELEIEALYGFKH